jgi:hypothetical protein
MVSVAVDEIFRHCKLPEIESFLSVKRLELQERKRQVRNILAEKYTEISFGSETLQILHENSQKLENIQQAIFQESNKLQSTEEFTIPSKDPSIRGVPPEYKFALLVRKCQFRKAFDLLRILESEKKPISNAAFKDKAISVLRGIGNIPLSQVKEVLICLREFDPNISEEEVYDSKTSEFENSSDINRSVNIFCSLVLFQEIGFVPGEGLRLQVESKATDFFQKSADYDTLKAKLYCLQEIPDIHSEVSETLLICAKRVCKEFYKANLEHGEMDDLRFSELLSTKEIDEIKKDLISQKISDIETDSSAVSRLEKLQKLKLLLPLTNNFQDLFRKNVNEAFKEEYNRELETFPEQFPYKRMHYELFVEKFKRKYQEVSDEIKIESLTDEPQKVNEVTSDLEKPKLFLFPNVVPLEFVLPEKEKKKRNSYVNAILLSQASN